MRSHACYNFSNLLWSRSFALSRASLKANATDIFCIFVCEPYLSECIQSESLNVRNRWLRLIEKEYGNHDYSELGVAIFRISLTHLNSTSMEDLCVQSLSAGVTKVNG